MEVWKMRTRKWIMAITLMLASPVFADGAQVLDHTVKDIDGNEVDLGKYKGEVVMIVNVASQCGFTPQYQQLVEVNKKYKEKGFTVLGFPANNFMRQEPGTDAEIKTFCTTKFGVDFPMFSKVSVKGAGQAPLYQELTDKDANGEFAGEISWNFEKFLVGRDGKVVARFSPRTKPDAPEVIAAIEKAIAE
jgi:glutathione peroxidase